MLWVRNISAFMQLLVKRTDKDNTVGTFYGCFKISFCCWIVTIRFELEIRLCQTWSSSAWRVSASFDGHSRCVLIKRCLSMHCLQSSHPDLEFVPFHAFVKAASSAWDFLLRDMTLAHLPLRNPFYSSPFCLPTLPESFTIPVCSVWNFSWVLCPLLC